MVLSLIPSRIVHTHFKRRQREREREGEREIDRERARERESGKEGRGDLISFSFEGC